MVVTIVKRPPVELAMMAKPLNALVVNQDRQASIPLVFPARRTLRAERLAVAISGAGEIDPDLG